MSFSRSGKSRLYCDVEICLSYLHWDAYQSKTFSESQARRSGWRKDKLGRNICPAHPKLKGARRG